MAMADAETDRLPNPELFAAKEDAVVGALACCCGVIAQRFDEGEAVVYHFGSEDATVHLCVPNAIAAFDDFFPINTFIIVIGCG